MKKLENINLNEFLKNYNPFKKTALKRTNLSQPMKILFKKGVLDNKTNIDYGTGHGIDWKILNKQHSKENNFNIVGYDLYNEEFHDTNLITDKHYDNLFAFYMLNVLPELHKQEELIKLFKSLADNVYICVRADKRSVKDNWLYVKEWEGYITPKFSFQRFYDKENIKRYFGDVEYISNNSSFKLFKLL